MGRPRKSDADKQKSKWEDLDQDFKDNVETLSEEDLRKKISEVALNQVALTKAKKEDQDLNEKREILKEAGSVYREGAKLNGLKIGYIREILENRGKYVGTFVQS